MVTFSLFEQSFPSLSYIHVHVSITNEHYTLNDVQKFLFVAMLDHILLITYNPICKPNLLALGLTLNDLQVQALKKYCYWCPVWCLQVG